MKVFIIIILFGALIFACDSRITEPEIRQIGSDDFEFDASLFKSSEFHKESWTLLIYMSADNDLEPYAIEDINELEAAFDFSQHGVKVLVLIDRAPGYSTANGDWTGTRLYEIQHDEIDSDFFVSQQLTSVELGLDLGQDVELNMGDPDTLQAFIKDGTNRYDSDHVGIVFWGHGSGFRNLEEEEEEELTKLVSYDYSDNFDALYTQSIATTLNEHDISLVGFDSCLGGNIEVAYELRNSADVFVASPDLELADGWEYDYLLLKFMVTSGSPEDLGRSVVSAFEDRYKENAYSTIGAIDLSKMDWVYHELNDFSRALSETVMNDRGAREELLVELFTNVEDIVVLPGMFSLDLHDLAVHFGSRLQDSDASFLSTGVRIEAGELQEAMEEAIIAQWAHSVGNSRSSGLSIALTLVNENGSISNYPHGYYYIRGESVSYPLAFVADSDWVPDIRNRSGLLYYLLYAR